MSGSNSSIGLDFIRSRVADDVAAGRNGGTVVTRFPPEPNGYLHIGHAKSICLNFGLAAEYAPKARCHMRFDDTNPVKESSEFVESILADVRWLGYDWGEHLYFASDYFERLYDLAVELIRMGKAFVCDLDADAMRAYRGTLTEPGRPSPYRDRDVDENLDLFARMRAGEFPDGSRTLRAKIDMASGNINMRDPVLYRIRRERHHRSGDAWCIYPSYDFAHPLSDAIEGVTHSLCTLEFEDHRPLYDWLVEALPLAARPQQIEFARLNLTYTVLSKRKLLELVQGGHVHGWDDPRMPTLAGLRRRGVPAAAIRDFCDRIGISKANSRTDIGLLEHCIREELNRTAPRAMAVLDPVKLVIENYAGAGIEWFDAENNPEDPSAGNRRIPFGRELWVERSDVALDPPKGWFRFAFGQEVRLKHAFYVTLNRIECDDSGAVTTLYGSYDPATRGGWSDDGRKVKGTVHWVAVAHAHQVQVRLYDRLFVCENPDDAPGDDGFLTNLNPDSVRIVRAMGEPVLAQSAPGTHWQFLRNGYFFADPIDSVAGQPVFNRVVGLRDSWAKRAG